MLEVPDLNLGSIDAINYNNHQHKEFFNKVLFREEYLDQILDRNRYFVIGEKGTGKTSYAVFLDNADYRQTLSKIVSLTQTDYQRFVTLSEMGKFAISNYVDIWKVILLLLVSESVCEKFPKSFLGFPLFKTLKGVIDEYYSSSFRPEVDQSLDMVENSEIAARLMAKYAEVSAKQGRSFHQTFTNIQVNLSFLEQQFKAAIASLKLQRDFILFIDGIDIRPDKIDYPNYIECIKGLANAVWQLNTEFFANIKDRKGSNIKVMLLMRPDILDSMGFQNLNSKVRDNGINLNWMTTYESFATSKLFRMITGIISKQQDILDVKPTKIWERYFPYELENKRVSGRMDDPFIGLLRYSFYRPRDIIQYLQLMQTYIKDRDIQKAVFSKEAFYSCQIDFSNYLLGEVKDYLSFYHSTVDFDEVVGFFSEFGGKAAFSYNEFQAAFDNHSKRLEGKTLTIKELTSSGDDLLQFLYSLNVIGYTERTESNGVFVHYSFRDRTTVKLRPKMKFNLEYQVHPGLQRALLVSSVSLTKRKPERLIPDARRGTRRVRKAQVKER